MAAAYIPRDSNAERQKMLSISCEAWSQSAARFCDNECSEPFGNDGLPICRPDCMLARFLLTRRIDMAARMILPVKRPTELAGQMDILDLQSPI